MYNRDKIIQTLHNIKAEAANIKPFVVIAQPKRNKEETPAQTFNGYSLCHVAIMGHSHGYVDCEKMLVDVARNYLIDSVLDSGAKYMFFIGDDTVVPYNAFENLLKTCEDNPGHIATGVYYIKCAHAMISVKKDDHIIVPDVSPGQIIDAWQTGMDCMLIPVETLRRMKDEDPDLPFCCIANGIEDIPFVGEDNFFLHRCRKSGVKVLVNTDVQCLHMDIATGKYTAHPSVNLNHYFTNIKPTGTLTIDDKKFIDYRWVSRLPGAINNPKEGYREWLSGQDIPKIIEGVSKPVGIEVGTADGTTTAYLLKTIPDLTLYGIDPYTDYIDWNGGKIISAENERVYNERTFTFKDRLTHLRITSDEAVGHFDNESMDFVFIDGLHEYQQVKTDIENYWKKVKKGGVLIGHDFAMIEAVNKAVNEFSDKVGLEIQNAQQDLWYIRKPK
jgi:hypothetical protein